MSGFDGPAGTYGLTPTKCEYWHRFHQCTDGPIQHLLDAGFVVRNMGSWWQISGPGLAEQSTDRMYNVISGRQFGSARPRVNRDRLQPAPAKAKCVRTCCFESSGSTQLANSVSAPKEKGSDLQ